MMTPRQFTILVAVSKGRTSRISIASHAGVSDSRARHLMRRLRRYITWNRKWGEPYRTSLTEEGKQLLKKYSKQYDLEGKTAFFTRWAFNRGVFQARILSYPSKLLPSILLELRKEDLLEGESTIIRAQEFEICLTEEELKKDLRRRAYKRLRRLQKKVEGALEKEPSNHKRLFSLGRKVEKTLEVLQRVGTKEI